jgi:hypothetical protein
LVVVVVNEGDKLSTTEEISERKGAPARIYAMAPKTVYCRTARGLKERRPAPEEDLESEVEDFAIIIYSS